MKHLFLILFLFVTAQQARAQTCNTTFTTQAQVNAFAATGCTTVASLNITGGSATGAPGEIFDLSPLSTITAVTGDVYLNMRDLADIQGLNNIQTIGGSLTIINATNISDLSINTGPSNAFANLQSVGGNFTVVNCPSLLNISGFALLRSASTAVIQGNNGLVNITGMNGLQTTGLLTIHQCAALQSITGFNGLITVPARSAILTSSVDISNNPSLRQILGFTALRSTDALNISSNAALQQVTGFNQLRNIKNLGIDNNVSLLSIAGFTGPLTADINASIAGNTLLTSITGFTGANLHALSISSNPALTEVTGFTNLQSVNVNIGYNPGLVKISGFHNSTITGNLAITYNPQLDSITGFTGAAVPAMIYLTGNPLLRSFVRGLTYTNYTPLTSLSIDGNTRLAVCSVSWVCQYLRRSGIANITNNLPSCAPAAILQSCQALATQPAVVPAVAYPNPVTDVLTLSSPSAYTVRDLLGRVLRQGQGAQVSMADLPAGVYLVESGKEAKRSWRIVKQ